MRFPSVPIRYRRFLILLIVFFILYRFLLHSTSPNSSPSAPSTSSATSGYSSSAPPALHPESGAFKPGRVFIASIQFNTAASLPLWTAAVAQLIRTIGVENVFVSVAESGSTDGTKDRLREFDLTLKRLGVQNRRIVMDDEVLEQLKNPPKAYREGWTYTSRKKWELRKVPVQAKLRNRALEPLLEAHANGTDFRHVLFLNNVVFDPEDAIRLLGTNNGKYAAACGLDFLSPPQLHDTASLRDYTGATPISKNHPFFPIGRTRTGLLKGDSSVLVRSCWNGMVAFNAAAFLPPHSLRFRSIDDDLAWYRVEGSERCIVHYDNPLTGTEGVWVNPRVRVAYDENGLKRLRDMPLSGWRRPKFILKGEETVARLKKGKDREVARRVEEWGKTEIARDCLVGSVQVLGMDTSGEEVEQVLVGGEEEKK